MLDRACVNAWRKDAARTKGSTGCQQVGASHRKHPPWGSNPQAGRVQDDAFLIFLSTYWPYWRTPCFHRASDCSSPLDLLRRSDTTATWHLLMNHLSIGLAPRDATCMLIPKRDRVGGGAMHASSRARRSGTHQAHGQSREHHAAGNTARVQSRRPRAQDYMQVSLHRARSKRPMQLLICRCGGGRAAPRVPRAAKLSLNQSKKPTTGALALLRTSASFVYYPVVPQAPSLYYAPPPP